MAKKRRKKNNWVADARYELYGLAIIILSIVALSETWGAVGRSLRYMLRFVAGNWEFLIPPIMIGVGIYVMVKRRWPKLWSLRGFGLILLLLTILIYNHSGLYTELSNEGAFQVNIVEQTYQRIIAEIDGPKQAIGGGLVGAFFFMILYYLFGHYGTLLVTAFMLLIAIMFLTGFTLEKGFYYIKRAFNYTRRIFSHHMRQLLMRLRMRRSTQVQGNSSMTDDTELEDASTEEDEEVILPIKQAHTAHGRERQPQIHDFEQHAERLHSEQLRLFQEEEETEEDSIASIPTSIEVLNSDYKLPSYNLLNRPKKSSARDHRDINSNVQKLEQTLKSFGVNARVIDVHRGPAVTRYEIQPDSGVKVSRIVSLTDDIALALAAKDIRMEAPIPGKAAIGIEVPNEQVSMVTLREVLESSHFHENRSKLSVALGRDISGEPIVANLGKMPHLLVAGATGSGKSVCINSIVASILYKAKPHEVKLMMIDPKMVELNVYNGIPHLLTPVVTDPRKASMALKKVVAEMERRYEAFASVGARDIERYNQHLLTENKDIQPNALLPYIVVIVDELADLMMVASSDVEDSITRLAQKARACGIHLILATQRPSVDVITGVIKANIPSRIAFSVSSQVDSRTILDMAGAEKLLGKGDMLFLPMGSSKVTRIQGCFVDDREIEAIVNFIKQEQEVQYVEEMIPEDIPEAEGMEMEDELYDRAVQLIAETQTASVSLIQRRLRVGYARAARLMDMMEAKGIVGPYEGSKPREVFIPRKENSNIS